MTANRREGEIARKIDLRKLGEYRNWNEFLWDWNHAVARKLPPISLVRGLVHGGAELIFQNPNDRLRRINFYLVLADRSQEEFERNSSVTRFEELAYNRLITYLLRPDITIHLNTYGQCYLRDDYGGHQDEVYNEFLFVETLKKIVEFFSHPANKPRLMSKEPRYAHYIAETLQAIHDFWLPDYRSSCCVEIRETLSKVHENIPLALAICGLYEPIVENKMYGAMQLLSQMRCQDNEEKLIDRLLSLGALKDERCDLIADLILALHLKPDHVFETYVILWAMKNAPGEETRAFRRQMAITDGPLSFRPDNPQSRSLRLPEGSGGGGSGSDG